MTETTLTSQGTQYVTLGIDHEVFAVAVEHVREILDYRAPSRLPHAPSFMAGILDVRGQGVPVVDLRVKLGLNAVPATEQTRILVLEVPVGERSLIMGLIADRVIEVALLSGDSLQPPPDVGVRWRSDYIQAIGQVGGNFVVIFDLSRLFGSDEVALMGEAV